ncbi:MAG: PorT family protein [Chitinophagaceae bacterium]|nr:PorT family protein [Chitinophagaceae bacterium]
MKAKFLPAVLFLSFISLAATAQLKPVIKAGIINSTWNGDAQQTLGSVLDKTNGILDSRSRTGFYIGGAVDLPLGEIISIEPGLTYTQRGYGLRGNLTINQLKIDALNARATAQMSYIDFSVLIKVKPAGGLTLFAGPQVSCLAKNNLRADVAVPGFSLLNTNLDITNQFNWFDVGVTGGVGYEFANGFGINAAFERGFNRIDKNQNFRAFNQGIKAGITYKF